MRQTISVFAEDGVRPEGCRHIRDLRQKQETEGEKLGSQKEFQNLENQLLQTYIITLNDFIHDENHTWITGT